MRAHACRHFGVPTFGSQRNDEQRPNKRVVVIQFPKRIALAAIKTAQKCPERPARL